MFRFVFALLLFCASSAHATERLLVFAAASQKEALETIGELYEKRCSCDIAFSVAATSTLARQIAAGANADVFISANEAWADWLAIRKKTGFDDRAVIAGNRLVIATASRMKDSFNILLRGRFSMADPVSVPAGIYAREALESLGIWDEARRNAVFGENVRVALSSIVRGDLLSGIVYSSDLRLVPQLNASFVFPEGTHSPIRYIAAPVEGSKAGAGFVDYLLSEEAQQVFEHFGFLPASDTSEE